MARNSAAESEGGQKFLPPNPLPFCPPERSVWRAKRGNQSVPFKKGSRIFKDKAQEKAIEELEKEKKAVQAQLQKEKACNDYNRIQAEIKDVCGVLPYPGIDGCIWEWQNQIQFGYGQKVEKLKGLKTQYLSAAQGCDISLEEENQKSQRFILKQGEYQPAEIPPLY